MIRHLTIFLLCLIPLVAQAQDDAAPAALTFYNHPTERYNVLIPPGWANESTLEYAHLSNGDLGADLWAISLPATDTDSAALAVLALALPDVTATAVAADDVTLTTGLWSQRLLALPNGAAATAYVQTIGERTYAILYHSVVGVYPFVAQTDTALVDAAGAEAVFSETFALLDIDAVQSGELVQSPPDIEPPQFGGLYSAGDTQYRIVATRSSTSSADVIVGRDESVSDAHCIALTIVRDFFVTPETTTYLLLGLAAVAAVMALFIGLLGTRWRNLQKDEAALRQLIN